MVVGGGEEAWDVGNGFGEEEEKGKAVFPRLHEKKARMEDCTRGSSLVNHETWLQTPWWRMHERNRNDPIARAELYQLSYASSLTSGDPLVQSSILAFFSEPHELHFRSCVLHPRVWSHA